MDFKNMLERERLQSKKVSKTQAVTSNLKGELADKISDRNVHIGPSDYVEWLLLQSFLNDCTNFHASRLVVNYVSHLYGFRVYQITTFVYITRYLSHFIMGR